MNYNIYKGFPTYKEILIAYNELFEKIKDITTIKQAKEYQKKYGITIEINGILINEYIKNGGTDEKIEWIRYEEVNQLAYVYSWIEKGKIRNIYFDIYCEWSEDEFIQNVLWSDGILTQEQYYKAIEEHLNLYSNSKYEIIGCDTENLPDIKFKNLI